MTDRTDRRTDFTWRRGNLAALLALCTLAGGGLLGAGLSGRFDLAAQVVDAQRAAAAEEKIDPNTAPSASLQRLPRVGPVLADAICEYRRTHGPRPFRQLGDLAQVRGIGTAILLAAQPYLTLDAAPAE